MSQFTINKRLLSDILAKYRTTFDAFCELANNALQAGAREIRITLTKPSGFFSEHTFEKITIRDTGIGVSKSEFDWKILEIATDAKKDGKLTYLGKQLHTKDREVREVWEREFGDIPMHKLASLLKADGKA